MAEAVTEGHGANGHGWTVYAKLAGAGIAVGTVIVGMFTGLLKIDARLEMYGETLKAHGKSIEMLAESFKQTTERSITPDAVRDLVKLAVLELVAANPGKIASPYSPQRPKTKTVRTVPVRPVKK